MSAQPPPPAGEGLQPQEAAAPTVERLQQELQSATERYLRAVADFDNTRKRLQREKEEYARFSTESMVRDLLPIVDSLSQALVAVDKQADTDAVVKGVHLIYRQLLGLLEKEGVKRISTVGQVFDPHVHEAVAHVDAGPDNSDKIVEEVQAGYLMHGKVIRSALVKVGRHDGQKAEVREQKSEEEDHQPPTECMGG